VRNGTNPLLIDLASRACINVECRCGRVVQIAVYQLIGRNGIAGTTRAWSLRAVTLPEVQAPTDQEDVD